ncbi:MAG: hypothetical protein CEO21_212 [Microgenomates group bacterium Gr01-1014_80]|nr:MAG: hypothetical protein CEO21_212 [Microgenomates group bacterium Gr01-1014_80]
MITVERIELVTGVGTLLFRRSNPDQVAIARENNFKKLTGKLAGQWATTGYETRDPKPDGFMETFREVIDRYCREEIGVIRGQIYIPDNLEEAKLCVARISHPDDEAWVHVHDLPVSDDFEIVVGDFENG